MASLIKHSGSPYSKNIASTYSQFHDELFKKEKLVR